MTTETRTETLAQHAERLVAAYSRKAIREAHECLAHRDALAGDIGFALLGTHRYDDVGIDGLIRAARVAIVARSI